VNLSKPVERIDYTFSGCKHVIRRKPSEPMPRECPLCKRYLKRLEDAVIASDPFQLMPLTREILAHPDRED